ncbi:hypothetical protein V6N13_063884 [Hibiscus sabdariffa]
MGLLRWFSKTLLPWKKGGKAADVHSPGRKSFQKQKTCASFAVLYVKEKEDCSNNLATDVKAEKSEMLQNFEKASCFVSSDAPKAGIGTEVDFAFIEQLADGEQNFKTTLKNCNIEFNVSVNLLLTISMIGWMLVL